MLCAVDYIFNLLCAVNCLQPMKKFVFSVASRATGRLQIKPSGSGDENVDGPSSSLVSLKFRLPFFRCETVDGKDFQPLVQSGTVVFAARCYLPQKYFAIGQRSINRGWIKWAQVAGRVAWKPKVHDDVMLNGVFGICLWLVARQLRIPNR